MAVKVDSIEEAAYIAGQAAENKRLKEENARLRAIISAPVERFGTPELVSWANRLWEILSEYPEEDRGSAAFVFTMGAHLEKFAKAWNSPTIAAKDARIAALERALRKAQDRIYYAVDWRHEGADETLKQVWREIEEALGEAAAPEEEEAEHVR
jgi:hypothetical protein